MTYIEMPRSMPVEQVAARLGARPTDIPGLWHLPGYPELTTGQLLNIAITKLGLAGSLPIQETRDGTSWRAGEGG